MKRIALLIVGIGLVIALGKVAVDNIDTEVSYQAPSEPQFIEKEVAVQTLDKRVKDAQEASKAELLESHEEELEKQTGDY